MASGKTTFGRALAHALSMQFIDLDFFIEQRFHCKISELFATRSEEGFRKLESVMLREAGEFDNVIISCGGGTPCFNDNLNYMKERGSVICLTASVGCLCRRVMRRQGKRPLLAGLSGESLKEKIIADLNVRNKYYDDADIILKGDYLENRRQISESVEQFINNYLREEL